MIIRRLRIALPARLRATADRDGRALAEALAAELAARGLTGNQSLTLPSAGQTGAGIAQRVGSALPGTGGRHGD
jgi:hypothetical protein